MPKRPERIISWYPARQCWRKKYKGRTYYLATKGHCRDEHDQEGYMLAISEWQRIKQRIDAGQPEEALLQPVVMSSSRLGDVQLPLKQLHAAPFAYDYSRRPDQLPNAFFAHPQLLTVDEAIGAFVDEFKARARVGDCSISTYREAKDCLADFQGFARRYEQDKLEDISEHFLKCYRDVQRELVLKGEFSPHTARKRLMYLKRFLEWAYKNRYLESFPRNVDKHFARVVKLPDPAPKPFSLEEVKAIWKTATKKTKFSRKSYRSALYVLLGLNCGYRSGDIAALKHAHLRKEGSDWIIDRKREKTGSPQVHKLWPATYQLLTEEMSDSDEHENMLLDERGGLLVVESLESKTGATDCIGRIHNRLIAKLGWKGGGKGHSVLRDTGADTISKHFPEVPHIVSQYLGHKPKGMVTHYARQHYELLFQSLDWLDDHLGLKLP